MYSTAGISRDARSWFARSLGPLPANSPTWPARTTPHLPRSADGHVELTAPAPRTSHGTPDLSGLWIPEPDPNGKPEGVENTVFPRYLMNVTQDLEDAAHAPPVRRDDFETHHFAKGTPALNVLKLANGEMGANSLGAMRRRPSARAYSFTPGYSSSFNWYQTSPLASQAIPSGAE